MQIVAWRERDARHGMRGAPRNHSIAVAARALQNLRVGREPTTISLEEIMETAFQTIDADQLALITGANGFTDAMGRITETTVHDAKVGGVAGTVAGTVVGGVGGAIATGGPGVVPGAIAGGRAGGVIGTVGGAIVGFGRGLGHEFGWW
jgi:hypothetical protein